MFTFCFILYVPAKFYRNLCLWSYMLLICCYLSHQPARCLQFSCFCSLLTPTLSEVFRGILTWLLGPLSSKTELLPTSVSGNICLQVPECFAFQPSTCTRADNDLQFLAAILTSLNGATSRGYAVTVILMSKHPGGVLPPLLASCLSPHRSVLPSGASPKRSACQQVIHSRSLAPVEI